MAEGFELERFLKAQEGTYLSARAELAAGQKRTHWMWFIFPQIRGLGSSGMAQRYAISGLAEAREYLAHPVLGERLRECTRLVNGANGRGVDAIFGYPDDLKFHSSMTLFARVEMGVFQEALTLYFGGKEDPGTVKMLDGRGRAEAD